jgi:hypothetical protein
VLIAIFCTNARVSIADRTGGFFHVFFLRMSVYRLLKIKSHADQSGHQMPER